MNIDHKLSAAILIFAISSSLFAAPAQVAKFKIVPNQNPLGAYVVSHENAADAKSAETYGWITSGLASKITGKPVKTTGDLAPLNAKQAEIASYISKQIIMFYPTKNEAMKTDTVMQKDWLDSQSTGAAGGKCSYVDQNSFRLSPHIPQIFTVGWVDPNDGAAVRDYKNQSCDGEVSAYLKAGGANQFCGGYISCDAGKTAELCLCDVSKPIKTAQARGSDFSAYHGYCPPADDCIAQCHAKKTRKGQTIAADSAPGSANDAKFEQLAAGKTYKPRGLPLMIAAPDSKSAVCTYNIEVQPGIIGLAPCIVTGVHCPSPTACSVQICVGSSMSSLKTVPYRSH